MIRAKSITAMHGVINMIDSIDEGTPTGVQLLAATPSELRACLHTIEEQALSGCQPHWRNLSVIDLNFGCPKPEVAGQQLGPAMLKDPHTIASLFEVLAEFKSSSNLNIGAVGAKIRLGMDAVEMQSKVYLPVLEEANNHLDYLVVHGRHAAMKSSDLPLLDPIGEIKARAASSLAIIGNGNVSSADSAAHMMAYTGCDGVMVARAAIQNPWVFKDLSRVGPGGIILADKPLTDASEGLLPTLEEVNNAEQVCEEWESRFGKRTKNKYVTFRRLNFERLRQLIKTGEDVVVGNQVTRANKVHALKRKTL
eukprot:gene25565-31248_t